MLLSNYTRFNIHKMTLKRFMLPMVFERNTVYTLQQKNFESRSVHSFQFVSQKNLKVSESGVPYKSKAGGGSEIFSEKNK